jgi:hypothetical protein
LPSPVDIARAYSTGPALVVPYSTVLGLDRAAHSSMAPGIDHTASRGLLPDQTVYLPSLCCAMKTYGLKQQQLERGDVGARACAYTDWHELRSLTMFIAPAKLSAGSAIRLNTRPSYVAKSAPAYQVQGLRAETSSLARRRVSPREKTRACHGEVPRLRSHRQPRE